MLNAAYGSDLVVWIWAVVLTSSLISIVGFARAGSVLFWKAHGTDEIPTDEERPAPPGILSYTAVGGLIALLSLHTAFAGQVHGYTSAIAGQLFAPDAYMSTVLETPGKLSKPKEGEDH